jgi:hypothetical protein
MTAWLRADCNSRLFVNMIMWSHSFVSDKNMLM